MLRYHEIAEADHRILNPFTDEKLRLLGEICRLQPGMRILDLACGKGEMLCTWAAEWSISGVGVDLSAVFLESANDRRLELGVQDQVELVHADASQYQPEPKAFDVASCMGATWIGGGLIGTIELMRPAVRAPGLMLIGEPFWMDPPPPEAYEALGVNEDDFVSLEGTLKRLERADVEVVEMVMADQDSWDRYVAAQWWTITEWLRSNPDDEDFGAMKKFLDQARVSHLSFGRRYLGWGVFVLRPR